MSLWSKVKHAVHKAAEKVAQAAETVVNTVTEVASDTVETVGNAVESGLNKLGDAASGIPGIGGGISTAAHWLGRIAGAGSDLMTTGMKASGGLIAGSVGGLGRVGFGIATFDGSLIREGVVEMTSAVAAGIILFGAKTIALLQAAFPGIEQRRELTDEEKTLLRRVFRDSLALHNIRLVDSKYGAGVLGMGTRPYTLGNTIYLMGRRVAKEPELLVHECTHVWQYQNTGSSYASDAIAAQWFVPDAYNWEREIRRGNDQWPQFNREAQAKFLEDIYTNGQLTTYPYVPPKRSPHPHGTHSHIGSGVAPILAATATATVAPPVTSLPGGGVFYDADPPRSVGLFVFNGIDHTTRANRAMEIVRNAFNGRPSGALD